MNLSGNTPFVFCAIDTQDLSRACDLAKTVGPVTGGLKLGLEFFNSFGPQGVEAVREACPDAALFLDLKCHDIPNTVAGAVRTIARNLAPDYLNVHAAGGPAMLEAAQEACEGTTKLLGVTILTSLSAEDLETIGYAHSPEEQVIRMARLTQAAGLAGIVCSAHEIAAVRKACGEAFVLMVPGIRPEGAKAGDQSRIMTPSQALKTGATHLVIGRPVTQAPDPAQAAQDILDTLL